MMRTIEGSMLTAGLLTAAMSGSPAQAASPEAQSLHQADAIERTADITRLTFAQFSGHNATAKVAESPVAHEASNGYLDVAGPALSHDKATLNGQLDDILHEEGSDGHLAMMLARTAHITTKAGRDKYITGANVEVGQIKNITNKQYPMSSAFDPNTGALVPTPNTHAKSAVMTLVLDKYPSKSEAHGKLVDTADHKSALEITDDVVRLDCGGQNERGPKAPKVKHPRKIAENHFDIDVSVGVNADLAALAASQSSAASSSESGANVVCGPDGTEVHTNSQANAQAEANAFAVAVAQARATEKFHISGKNMKFSAFKVKYDQMVKAKATAIAAAASQSSSTSSSSTSVNCGPGTPPPVTPHTPGITISKQLIESLNADGSFYSNIVTKHGDTDVWKVVVKNVGNDALKAVFTDTPPEGEKNITFSGQPLGLKIDNLGVSTWTDSLAVNEEEAFTVETHNDDMPCFKNEENTVKVVGTDEAGNQVTDQATAPIKEENTGPDCIDTTPPVDNGPGQPLPPAAAAASN